MATKKTTTTESGNVKWTPEMLAYLAEHPTVPRTPLVEGFRAKFRDFPGSDQSIVGRRYRLLQDGSKAHPEIGLSALNARIAELEDELADLMDKRAQMEGGVEAAGEPETHDVTEALKGATYREVQQAAKNAGVQRQGQPRRAARPDRRSRLTAHHRAARSVVPLGRRSGVVVNIEPSLRSLLPGSFDLGLTLGHGTGNATGNTWLADGSPELAS